MNLRTDQPQPLHIRNIEVGNGNGKMKRGVGNYQCHTPRQAWLHFVIPHLKHLRCMSVEGGVLKMKNV